MRDAQNRLEKRLANDPFRTRKRASDVLELQHLTTMFLGNPSAAFPALGVRSEE